MADLKLGGGSARCWFCPTAAFSSLGAAPSPAPSLAGLLRLRSGICTGNLQARVSAAASGSTQPLVIFFLFFLIFMK